MKKISIYLIPRITSLILSLLIPLVSYSFVSMIQHDRLWQYSGSAGWDGSVYHTMRFQGEVEFLGKSYSVFTRINTKIYKYDKDTQLKYLYSDIDFTDNGLKYFIREEDGKTYAIAYFEDSADLSDGTIFYTTRPASSSLFESVGDGLFGEVLIYDTTLPDRSLINLPNIESSGSPSFMLENFLQVYGDPVEIDGKICKFGCYVDLDASIGDWKPNLSENFYEDIGENGWIEGIGILKTGCLAAYDILMRGGQGYDNTEFLNQDSWLQSVYTDDGQVLYGLPPVGLSINGISDNASPADSRMFDVMGREITSPAPGTVYIQGGKKFIAK